MNWNRKEFLRLLGIGGLAGLSGFQQSTSIDEPQHPSLKPPRLVKGDTIGLVSPGSIIPESEKYPEVINTIRELGFDVKVGNNAQNRRGYFAGTDRERAEDLNNFFIDPEVDAIMAFRGGWGSNRILSLIDFENIRQNPKPIIGFSDITTLLLAIHAKTGLVTFHGPVGNSEWTDFTLSSFKNVLMNASPVSMNNREGVKINTIFPGEAEGRLLGGNLTVLTSMLGSDYLPEWENGILFVEEIGEEVYRIDRMLTQLKLNGIFDKINGFIFGRCTDCKKDNNFSLSLEQILEDHIRPIEIPAFYGSMIGHIDDIFTLPLGINAKINSVTGRITLQERPTS